MTLEEKRAAVEADKQRVAALGFATTASSNYRGRQVCNGCGCLVTESDSRCVNEACRYYVPGVLNRP